MHRLRFLSRKGAVPRVSCALIEVKIAPLFLFSPVLACKRNLTAFSSGLWWCLSLWRTDGKRMVQVYTSLKRWSSHAFSVSSSFLPHCSISSGACGCFYMLMLKVGRLGGVCDGVGRWSCGSSSYHFFSLKPCTLFRCKQIQE